MEELKSNFKQSYCLHWIEVSGQLHALNRFTRVKENISNWRGGWMGTRTDLDSVQKRKMLAPVGDETPVIIIIIIIIII
jgi:hypothetical protein